MPGDEFEVAGLSGQALAATSSWAVVLSLFLPKRANHFGSPTYLTSLMFYEYCRNLVITKAFAVSKLFGGMDLKKEAGWEEEANRQHGCRVSMRN